MPRSQWTDADVERLIALERQGVSVEELARALGRSQRGVANKCHRLRLASGRAKQREPEPEVTLRNATNKQLRDEFSRRGLSAEPANLTGKRRAAKHRARRCPACKRVIHVCNDGRFGHHLVTTQLLPGGADPCPGAGTFPEPDEKPRPKPPPKTRTRKVKPRRRSQDFDAAELFAVLADGTEVRVTRAVANIDRLTTCELPRPARDDPHASATKRT